MDPILKGRSLADIGMEIKQRVRDDMGEWMRINVGIGPNRFLAKQAASWHKPDGLDVIDHKNLVEYYSQIKLTDLSGIAERNEARLNSFGIYTPLEFLEAGEYALKRQVFQSITGYYWYQRLRGHEIDDFDTHLGMVGRQWVVAEATKNGDRLNSCLGYLCETVGAKLRYRNVEARGICVWASYRNGEYYRNKRMYKSTFYTNQEVYRRALELFNQRPKGTVTTIGVYCYQLETSRESQLGLFEDVAKLGDLTKSMDEINDRYGIFTVHLASTLDGKRLIKQKIPFGGTEYFELLLKRA
jgi:DNA polymerase-4